jgi:hypothetical protein
VSDVELEAFYVYRSLHSDESWGAVVKCGKAMAALPNVDFGITVLANNEKKAIARGRDLYERIHKLDSDRSSIREFAKEALNSIIEVKKSELGSIQGYEQEIAQTAMKLAVEMNDEFKRYFDNVGGTEVQLAKDAADDARDARCGKINLCEKSNGRLQDGGSKLNKMLG